MEDSIPDQLLLPLTPETFPSSLREQVNFAIHAKFMYIVSFVIVMLGDFHGIV